MFVSEKIATHRKWFLRKFEEFWKQKVENSSKLKHFYYTFKHGFETKKYLQGRIDPFIRKTLATFRLGNHKLAAETLRYVTPQVPYEDRLCPFCKRKAESEAHFLQKCKAAIYTEARRDFTAKVTALVKNFDALSDDDKVFYLMTQENELAYKLLAEYT